MTYLYYVVGTAIVGAVVYLVPVVVVANYIEMIFNL